MGKLGSECVGRSRKWVREINVLRAESGKINKHINKEYNVLGDTTHHQIWLP